MVRKSHYLLLLLSFFVVLPSLYGQNDPVDGREKAGKKEKKKKEPKTTGMNILPFPYMTFDTDLGIEFGLSAPLVLYGDGKIYPKYYHRFLFSGSFYTKGSADVLVNYDSDYLIKGFNTIFDATYIGDLASDFYGFNGYESVYNFHWIDLKDPQYRSRMFYDQKRSFFRFRSFFKRSLRQSPFDLLFGIEFYNVKTSSVPIDRLNKKKKDDPLPSIDSVPPLYDRYIHWGLIPESEKDGGFFSMLKLGVDYDTRDDENLTMKGIWAEATLLEAPGFMSTMDGGFLKLAVYWRHYIPFIEDKFSFAYRINYQGTLAGHVPVYAQTFMFNSVPNGLYNDGLGGAKNLRGVLRNRVVGDGVLLGNFELRYKAFNFVLLRQLLDVVFSGFFDTGRILQYMDVREKIDQLTDEQIDYLHTGDVKSDYFNPGGEKFHNAAGAGLHLVVNKNIVVAFDFAKAFKKQDNDGLGVYIGSYFIF